MPLPVIARPTDSLLRLGLRISDTIHYQLPPEDLARHCLRRKEGVLGDTGALVIRTGVFTGRSPKDRYIVRDEITNGSVHWNDFNQPIDPAYFHRIFNAVTTSLNRHRTLRTRSLRLRRPTSPPQHPGHQRKPQREPFRLQYVPPAHGRGTRRIPPGMANPRRSWPLPQLCRMRHPQFHRRGHLLPSPLDRTRRHRIYRRDQKGRFYHPQLPPAPRPQRIEHALLRQRRSQRRHRHLLRP